MSFVKSGLWLACVCLSLGCGDSSEKSDAAKDASAQGGADAGDNGGGADPGDASAPGADASDQRDGAIDEGGMCAKLPSDAVIEPSPECTTDSGKWTQYTVNISDMGKSAFKQCNLEASVLYADQAAFDAAEGTSTVEGITITSNGDYVRTVNCASGSTEYENMGQKSSFVYIWELAP